MYYNPKGGKKGKYALRENTYRRMWYLIADYRYFKCIQAGFEEAEYWGHQLFPDSPPGTCTFPLGGPGEVKAGAAAETPAVYVPEGMQFDIEQIGSYIKAIEDALEKVPAVYAGYIMDHIIERRRYKDMEGVSDKTIKMWVQRFIWLVARNLGEV